MCSCGSVHLSNFPLFLWGETVPTFRLEEFVNFFCNVQTTKTKEEAFLKGLLFGLGAHNVCPTPNWELIKEYPQMIDIEKEMRESFECIHARDIKEAKSMLSTIQEGLKTLSKGE